MTARWQRSTFCSTNSCVLVDMSGERIRVKEGDAHVLGLPDPVLSFSREEWEAFVKGVKAGEFDADSQ